MGKILILFLFINACGFAQFEILKEVLKTGDELNKVLLDFTRLTDEEENQIGEGLDKKIIAGKAGFTTNKYDVKAVFAKIKKHVTRTKINYRFALVKDPEVNAFAVAGGNVYINSGLIDFISSEEELAFVIAHEIAHNELKHCINAIQYQVRASQVNPLLGDVVGIAYSLYRKPFSKDQEFAADEHAVKLLKKAGYSKNGGIEFFRKLEKLEEKYQQDKRGGLNDFISSHPLSKQRRERIEKM